MLRVLADIHGRGTKLPKRVFVLTSPEIWAFWAKRFLASFSVEPVVLFLAPGETHKTLRSVEKLLRQIEALPASIDLPDIDIEREIAPPTAPVMKVLHDNFKIVKGCVSTIHAYGPSHKSATAATARPRTRRCVGDVEEVTRGSGTRRETTGSGSP